MHNLVKRILPIYLFFTSVTLSFSQVKIDLEKRSMFSIKDTLEIIIDISELAKDYSDNQIFGSNHDDFVIRLDIAGEGRKIEFDLEGSEIDDHWKSKEVVIDLKQRLIQSTGKGFLDLIQSDETPYLFKYKSPSSMAELFNIQAPEYLEGLNINMEFLNSDLDGDITGFKVTSSESIVLYEGGEFNIVPFDQTMVPKEQLMYVSSPIKNNLTELINEINSDLLYDDDRFYQGSIPSGSQLADVDGDGEKELLARVYNYYLGYDYERVLSEEEKSKLISRIAAFDINMINDSIVYTLSWMHDEKSEGTNIYTIDFDSDSDLDIITRPDVFHGTEYNKPNFYGTEFLRPNGLYVNQGDGQIIVDSLNFIPPVYPGNFVQLDLDAALELLTIQKQREDNQLDIVIAQFENGEYTDQINFYDFNYVNEFGSIQMYDVNQDGYDDLLIFGSSSDFNGETIEMSLNDKRTCYFIAIYSDQGVINMDSSNIEVIYEFEMPLMLGWEGDPMHLVELNGGEIVLLNLIRGGDLFGEKVGDLPTSILKAFKIESGQVVDITSGIFPDDLDKSYFSLPNQPIIVDVNNDGLKDICWSTSDWTLGPQYNYSIPVILNNGDFFEPRFFANRVYPGFNEMTDIDNDGYVDVSASFFNVRRLGFESYWNGKFTWYNIVTDDKDLDGVVDSEDNAPDNYNPDQKDYDGDQIADVIDDDDDNDQVKDVNDECPNSALGVTVDAKGCEVFALPSNTFSVTVTSATCPDSSNGSITISSSNTDYSYRYAIDDQAPQALTDNTQTISNLSAGIYTVCVTVDGVSGYERCYTIEITEPAPLVASSRIDMSSRNMQLDLSGSEEYQVTINGKTFLTSEERLSLNLEPGMNRVEVATALDCQGVYFEEIFVSEEVKVYPNPTSGKTQVYIAGIDQKVVLIIRSLSGEIIDNINYDIPKNRVINIDLSSIPQGMFLLDIKGNTVNQIEKVIKE